MDRNNTIQYCFRLNLKNPDHLLIHETLMDLNLDIHKSKSLFIVESLLNTIKGCRRPDQLTKSGKSVYDSRQEYVTRGEIDEMKLVLEKDITREVSRDLMSVLLSALSSGNIKLPKAAEDKSNGSDQVISDKDRKETEAALSELSGMWSDD